MTKIVRITGHTRDICKQFGVSNTWLCQSAKSRGGTRSGLVIEYVENDRMPNDPLVLAKNAVDALSDEGRLNLLRCFEDVFNRMRS